MLGGRMVVSLFFFNDTATTEIYTLSLHGRSSDLAHSGASGSEVLPRERRPGRGAGREHRELCDKRLRRRRHGPDRKSTRLNSSHANLSYAVLFLKTSTDGAVDVTRRSGLLRSAAP